MRISLNETQAIEKYLLDSSQPDEEKLRWEKRILMDSELAEKVHLQKKVYQLVKQFGRKLFKRELDSIHQKLMNSADHARFQKTVAEIFHS